MADSIIYIALDFGTSYSGYAFSFREQVNDTVRLSKWVTESGDSTSKTPTCILFGEDQKFLKFGYEALSIYTRSTTNKEAKKLYLFEHFKMELYNKKIHRNLMITAKSGAEMKAMTIFSESLRYLMDEALKAIKMNTLDKEFIATDVTWILTVPAIWSAAAKQFMREAAIEAGLVTESEPERLIIALEPEAASVHCMQLPRDGFIAEDFSTDSLKQSPGTQYMVVDCGGGTIDITVHEVVDEESVKEQHAASGNDMGGQSVDGNVISFLKDIFSENVFDQFERERPAELLKLKFDIANIKSLSSDVIIWCPVGLKDIASKKQSMESYFESVQGASWKDGGILIKLQQLRMFFDDSLRAIKDSINKIMKSKEHNIEYMLLVGGYAQSPTLQNFMKEQFGSSQKILCPAEPQSIILKGAILYGKKTTVVKSRISTLTYGLALYEPFNESIHKGKSTYENTKGDKFCNVCFEKLVSTGESVLCDKVCVSNLYPTDPNQTFMRFTFFSTEKKNVNFVDEDGVDPTGSFTVNMPNTNGGMNRKILLEVRFGSTEMTATATDIDSKETESIVLDFMSK